MPPHTRTARLAPPALLLAVAFTASAALAMQPPHNPPPSRAGAPAIALDSYARALAARPHAPANLADGTWAELGPLQVNNALTCYDAVHDRLVTVGGSRTDVWSLPLGGQPVWQWQPSDLPKGPLTVGRSTYDAVDGLVYYLGFDGTGLSAFTLDPQTGATAAVAAAGAPPEVPDFFGLAFDADARRLFVLSMGAYGLPTEVTVTVLDLLPAPAWSQWTPAGTPPPTIPFQPIVDPVRRQLVLLGWQMSGPSQNWTLNLDGPPEWTSHVTNGLSVSGPNPVAYDPVADVLWNLDGQGHASRMNLLNHQWTSVPASGPAPAPRGSAGVAIDVPRHRLLVTGGLSPAGDDLHSDTWALSLDGVPTWTVLVPDITRPTVRGGASDGEDPLRHRLVVFGGTDQLGAPRNDTWALGLSPALTWSRMESQGTPPPARFWHASAWDGAHDRLVVYGGDLGDAVHPDGAVWTLSFGSEPPLWTPVDVPGAGPSPRLLHSLVYDSARDRFLALFGYDGLHELGDVWELRLAPAPAWRQLAPAGAGPAARSAAMCLYDGPRDRVLVFGGSTASDWTNELWALNLDAGDGAWESIATTTSPPGRNLGLFRYDSHRDRLLLFGGYGKDFSDPNYVNIIYLNDTWALDLGGAPDWRPLSPGGPTPAGRDRANGVYDPLHDGLVVTCGGTQGLNDTWMLAFGDAPTPTLLALGSQEARFDLVRLVWAGAQPGEILEAFRSDDGVAWVSKGVLTADGEGFVTLEDRDVVPGSTYYYRLGVTVEGGVAWLGRTSVLVPRPSLALSARAVGGRPTFLFDLPSDVPATLALFDVTGRRVWSRDVGALGAGAHEVQVDDPTLPPALYFARLSQGAAVRHARVVLLR